MKGAQMLRKAGAVVAVLVALAPSARAQFAEPTDAPATTSSGRTPRVPRRSASSEPRATFAPAADAPAHSETGANPPAPVGVARSRVRSHVETDGTRAIALTLDDGYRPDPRILDLIRSYGIHGTAFLVGAVADSDPGLVNELAQLGWLVCSHTYDHELLTGRSLEGIRREIMRGVDAVQRVVGYRCPYFRAPYGAVDANVVAVTDELGLQLIGWEASLSDSAPKGTDPDLQLSIAQRDVRPGSILLGHFGGTNSYDVLSRLLDWLSDENYSVGSVAELIDGNTKRLAQIGTSNVSVDVPGVAGAAAVMPTRPTATHPWSLSVAETVLDVAAVVLIMLLIRRRFGAHRRRRRRPETLSDLLLDVPLPQPYVRPAVEPPNDAPDLVAVELPRGQPQDVPPDAPVAALSADLDHDVVPGF